MTDKKYIVGALFGLLALAFILILNSSGAQSGERLVDVIERETTPTKLETLEAEMIPVVDAIPAHMTFLLRDLQTNETVVINNDRSYIAASLYKLFVAYYAYGEIDAGNISLDTVLSNKQTLNGCLNLMITISDNECGELLGDLFGWANIDEKIHANGFPDTYLNQRNTPDGDFATTPTDIDSFFTRLYKHELMNTANTDHLMNLLFNQEINDRLPPVLPSGVAVAHKTGDVYNYIHDVGIIYSENGDYAFVMMSSEWAEDMLFGPGYDYFQAMYNVIFNNI